MTKMGDKYKASESMESISSSKKVAIDECDNEYQEKEKKKTVLYMIGYGL